jgi:hypothetical protein
MSFAATKTRHIGDDPKSELYDPVVMNRRNFLTALGVGSGSLLSLPAVAKTRASDRRVIGIARGYKLSDKLVQIRLRFLSHKHCSWLRGYRCGGKLPRLLLGSLLCNQGIKRLVHRFNGNSKIQILTFDPLERGDTYNQSVLVQNG